MKKSPRLFSMPGFALLLCLSCISMATLSSSAWAIRAMEIPFQTVAGSPSAPGVTTSVSRAPQGPPRGVEGLIKQTPKGEIPPEVLERAQQIIQGQAFPGSGGQGALYEKDWPFFRESEETIWRAQAEELTPVEQVPVEELSTFERYVRGLISAGVDRNLSQFGYDLFAPQVVTRYVPVQEPPPAYPEERPDVSPREGAYPVSQAPTYTPGEPAYSRPEEGVYERRPGEPAYSRPEEGVYERRPGEPAYSRPEEGVYERRPGEPTYSRPEEGVYERQPGAPTYARPRESAYVPLRYAYPRYHLISPLTQLPVDPSYTLGPGDEIQLRVWGKVTGDYSIIVDREGYIHIPSVGDVLVAGVRYGELKNYLKTELSKYYTGFDLSARMGKLRSIRIFVVGKARKPGTYGVSNLSSIIHALFAAEGPSKTGSMRDIQLIRQGQTISRFDLYDFILKGDKSKDMVLQEGDVIFIPFVGPLVAIAGMVKEPAIYELKGEKYLLDLIEMAGGITAMGYTPRVQVERISDNKYRTVLDVNLKELTPVKNIPLRDGDIVQVFPIGPSVVNSVQLEGNVLRPGLYGWKEGLRVSDVITKPEDLKPGSLFDFAMVRRLVPPDYHEELLSFNLGKALQKDPKEDILLQPLDSLYVFSKDEFKIQPVVRIAGAIWRAGEYRLRQNMTVSDLIKLAGGLRPEAYKEGEITRVRVTQQGPVTERIHVDIFRAMAEAPDQDRLLEENDYLFVRNVPNWDLYRLVKLTGEVKYPGTYAVKKGERLSSLITRAGGFTEKAYLSGAFFARKSIQELQRKRLQESLDRLEIQMASVNLRAALGARSKDQVEMEAEAARRREELLARLKSVEPTGRLVIQLAPLEKLKENPSDIELEDGDTLHIPEVANSIYVMGAVYNPTAFLYEPDRNVRFYLAKAGGLTPSADKNEIYVLKVDGRAVPPNQISHLVTWNHNANRFEMDQFVALRLEPGDTIIVPEELEAIPFIKRLGDITTILYQIAVAAGVLFTAIF